MPRLLKTHKNRFYALLNPAGQLGTDVEGNVLLYSDKPSLDEIDIEDGWTIVYSTLTYAT